ncbi:MAG: hypothetical protein R2815_00085 [Flavobacteriales bacterium]
MGSSARQDRYRVRVAGWLLCFFLLSIGAISAFTALPAQGGDLTELPAPTPLNEEEVKHTRTSIADGPCLGAIGLPLIEVRMDLEEGYLPSPCSDVLERPPRRSV